MQKQLFGAATLLAALLMPFSACKKDKIDDLKTNLAALRAQAQTEQSIAVVIDILQEEISQMPELNSDLVGQPIGQCPTVTLSSTTFPSILTIDFGNGCTTRKGHQMSGKMEAIVSGKTDVTGASLEVSFDQLHVNGNALSGQVLLVTTGTTGAAQQNLSLTVTNLVAATTDGKTVTLTQLTGTRQQVAGQATTPKSNGGLQALQDDVFEIAFEASGTNAEGTAFQLVTTTPLRRAYDCRYIVSGVIEYTTASDEKTASYGDGTCDNQLEVQIGAVTKIVLLP